MSKHIPDYGNTGVDIYEFFKEPPARLYDLAKNQPHRMEFFCEVLERIPKHIISKAVAEIENDRKPSRG